MVKSTKNSKKDNPKENSKARGGKKRAAKSKSDNLNSSAGKNFISLADIPKTPEAKQVLDSYLDKLTGQVDLTDVEQKELVQNTKEQLLESLNKKVGSKSSKNNKLDAQMVLEVLGEMDSVEKLLAPSKEENSTKETPEIKTLYRSRRGKIIGGVAQGIADYLRVDVVIVRLLFILGFLNWGTSLLIYIILWVLLPEKDGLSVLKSQSQSDTKTSSIFSQSQSLLAGGKDRSFKQVLIILSKLVVAFLFFLLIVAVYIPILVVLFGLLIACFTWPVFWLLGASNNWPTAYFYLAGWFTPVAAISLGVIVFFFILKLVNFLSYLHLKREVFAKNNFVFFKNLSLVSFLILVIIGSYVFLKNRQQAQVIKINNFEASPEVFFRLQDSLMSGTNIKVYGDDDVQEIIIKEIRQARGFTISDAQKKAELIETYYRRQDDMFFLEVVPASQFVSSFESITFEIILPANTNLHLENQVGYTKVYDLDNEDIEIDNKVGEVVMENVVSLQGRLISQTGSVRVMESSFSGSIENKVGEIIVKNHQGSLDVRSSVGSIRIELADVSEDDYYQVYSSVGSIDLILPEGLDPFFDLNNSVGDTDNFYKSTPTGDRPTFKVRSSVGSISIR